MNKRILFFIILMHFFYAAASISEIPQVISGENLLTGKTVSISTTDETKKGLVVIFMSAKCPCSNSHSSLIKKLSDQYKDFKFVAVHSNADEPKSLAQNYFKSVHFSFDVIEDQKTKIADQLKAFKTPHSFLISPKGEVLYQGGVTSSTNAETADKQYLAEALEDVLQGKKVRTPEGRTLGCVIIREGDKNVF